MSTIAIFFLCWGVLLVGFIFGLALGRWFGRPAEDTGFYKKVRSINREVGYFAAMRDLSDLGVHWQIIKRLEVAHKLRAKLEDWPSTAPKPIKCPE